MLPAIIPAGYGNPHAHTGISGPFRVHFTGETPDGHVADVTRTPESSTFSADSPVFDRPGLYQFHMDRCCDVSVFVFPAAVRSLAGLTGRNSKPAHDVLKSTLHHSSAARFVEEFENPDLDQDDPRALVIACQRMVEPYSLSNLGWA